MDTSTEPEQRPAYLYVVEWTGMFAMNAGLPLIAIIFLHFAILKVGMLLALALLWLTGAVLYRRKFGPMRSMVFGAPFLALLQLLPILQLVAFFLSGTLVQKHIELGWVRKYSPELADGIQGFLFVIMSAIPLMALATFIGYIRRWRAGEFEEKES